MMTTNVIGTGSTPRSASRYGGCQLPPPGSITLTPVEAPTTPRCSLPTLTPKGPGTPEREVPAHSHGKRSDPFEGG